MANEFLMWGQQGLISAFLADLAAATPAALNRFLTGIQWAGTNKLADGFKPVSMWCAAGPDLGGKGFGRPAGLMRLENAAGKKMILIIEAEKTTYGNASRNPALRGTKGFNRSINGRLEINYCLAEALSKFNKRLKTLKDPEWVMWTAYNIERRDLPRTLKDANTIEQIVRPIAGQRQAAYCHLVITTDDLNPFNYEGHVPELFNQKGDDIWGKACGRYGWLNYEAMADIITSKRSRFRESLEAFNANLDAPPAPPEIERPDAGNGMSIVSVPELCPDGLCLFSWQKSKAVLRRFPDPKSKPEVIGRYKTASVRSLLEVELLPETRKPVTHAKTWAPYISEFERWGVGSLCKQMAELAGLEFNEPVSIVLDRNLYKDDIEVLLDAGAGIQRPMVAKCAPRKMRKADLPDLENRIPRFPLSTSVLETMGSYNPITNEITICTNMCRLTALAMNLDAESIMRVVFGHMAGHLVTHRGLDAAGRSWKRYTDAVSNDREVYAQVYALLAWRARGDGDAEQTFRALSRLQSPAYNTWGDFLYMQMDNINHGFLAARSAEMPAVEIQIHTYDGKNPWTPIHIITNDGRIFRTEYEGIDWRNLSVTSYHMEPYIVPREQMQALKDYIVSQDAIYIPGGVLKARVVTDGERGNTTFRIKVGNMENEWTGVSRDWGDYAIVFRTISRLFEEALEAALG